MAQNISILMYHQVGEFDRPDSHRATFCHIRRFKAQMAYLHAFGYKVISLQTALDGLFGNGRLPRHSVVLTFDDGYDNFSQNASPVLQRHGYPATVFLVVDLLGGHAKWLAEDGRHAAALMDKATIRELQSSKIVFGSHTLTHPFLTRIDPERQAREIAESKSALEDLLGEEVTSFCYPAGDYDEKVVKLVREAGYKAALTCDRGAATPGEDPLKLPRKAISFGDSLIGYFWKLHMKHRKKIQKRKGA